MPIKKERRITEGTGKVFFARYEKDGVAIIKYWDMEEFGKEKASDKKVDYFICRQEDYFFFLIPRRRKSGYPFPVLGEYKYGLADCTQYSIINPNQPHLGSLNQKPSGKKYTKIYIHKDFVKKVFLDLNLKYPEKEIEFKTGARLRTAIFDNICGILCHGFHADDIGDILFVETALHQFIAHVLRIHPGNFTPLDRKMLECLPDDDRIRLALDYIRDNFSKEITIEELSKISCLSRSHFLYLFKKKTGETPYKYLSNYRLRKAMELLKDRNKDIGDICNLIGCSSEKQFHYLISKHFKKTPRQIRKELLK